MGVEDDNTSERASQELKDRLRSLAEGYLKAVDGQLKDQIFSEAVHKQLEEARSLLSELLEQFLERSTGAQLQELQKTFEKIKLKLPELFNESLERLIFRTSHLKAVINAVLLDTHITYSVATDARLGQIAGHLTDLMKLFDEDKPDLDDVSKTLKEMEREVQGLIMNPLVIPDSLKDGKLI